MGVEMVGYIASGLVLISFAFKNITQLRLINSVGCAFFIAYGIMLDSLPIIITNVSIVLINAYFLLKPKFSK